MQIQNLSYLSILLILFNKIFYLLFYADFCMPCNPTYIIVSCNKICSFTSMCILHIAFLAVGKGRGNTVMGRVNFVFLLVLKNMYYLSVGPVVLLTSSVLNQINFLISQCYICRQIQNNIFNQQYVIFMFLEN